MLEVELKYPIADASAIEAALCRLGAEVLETRDDVDHYFSAPDRNFATTDEAVRVRQSGEQNALTYKGPKLDAETKTRQEIEVPLAPGAAVAELAVRWLRAIRYHPVAEVRKRRRRFRLSCQEFTVELCLDAVDHLGHFLELEILADEPNIPRARTVLLELAAILGLQKPERRSYLQLLQERKNSCLA